MGRKKVSPKKGLMNWYFKGILPPYSTKDFLPFFLTILIVVGLYFGLGQAFAGKGSFVNVASALSLDKATFNFEYTSTSPNYKIDISTSSNMKQNLVRNFGQGSYSPIVVLNPQSSYKYYVCGSTLYWIIKATDQRTGAEIKSGVQMAKVNCTVPSPTVSSTSTPIPSQVPTATPTPITSCNPQPKPSSVSLQGADGTWCLDSDGGGSYTTPGSCVDSCSSGNDYCQQDGTARDGYCTGTWTGVWNNVHCEFGGYVCPSFGKACIDGACQ